MSETQQHARLEVVGTVVVSVDPANDTLGTPLARSAGGGTPAMAIFSAEKEGMALDDGDPRRVQRDAAVLARRLLTLAATRGAAGSRPWEWVEVESIASRILALLTVRADAEPRG